MKLLEELFQKNSEEIKRNSNLISQMSEGINISDATYSLVQSTLAEANEFAPTNLQIRFITNARKSGETAGNGTGLPAFWDYLGVTPKWVDFMGNPIVV